MGNDVVVTGSGQLVTAGSTLRYTDAFPANLNENEITIETGSFVNHGTRVNHMVPNAYYSSRKTFGMASQIFFATPGTNDEVTLGIGFNEVAAPVDHVSGKALTSSNTYANQSLASLGLVVGTHAYGDSATYGGAMTSPPRWPSAASPSSPAWALPGFRRRHAVAC